MKTLANPKDATPHPALNRSVDAARDGAARPTRPRTLAASPLAAASPRVTAQARLADRLAHGPRMVAQRQALRDSLGSAVQLRGPEEEELQMKQKARSAQPAQVENTCPNTSSSASSRCPESPWPTSASTTTHLNRRNSTLWPTHRAATSTSGREARPLLRRGEAPAVAEGLLRAARVVPVLYAEQPA